jgi:hypothetical protein
MGKPHGPRKSGNSDRWPDGSRKLDLPLVDRRVAGEGRAATASIGRSSAAAPMGDAAAAGQH